jgi:hypothetical protein
VTDVGGSFVAVAEDDDVEADCVGEGGGDILDKC